MIGQFAPTGSSADELTMVERDPSVWDLGAEESLRRRILFWELFTLDAWLVSYQSTQLSNVLSTVLEHSLWSTTVDGCSLYGLQVS